MSQKPRYIILIIRISHDLAVVLVWIICSPRQNIGGGFHYASLQIFCLLYIPPLVPKTRQNWLLVTSYPRLSKSRFSAPEHVFNQNSLASQSQHIKVAHYQKAG